MTEIYIGPIEEVKLVEKVKLTKEQAEAIEYGLSNGFDIDSFIQEHSKFKWGSKPYSNLNGMPIHLLARALYTDYEVEETFKPGDKVLLNVNRLISVETLTMKNPHVKGDWGTEQGCGCISEKDFRHATPEEIFWLETLGRDEVGAFHYGDIVVTDLNVPIKVGEYDVPGRLIGLERTLKFYKNKSLNGIYPAESFKAIPGGSK